MLASSTRRPTTLNRTRRARGAVGRSHPPFTASSDGSVLASYSYDVYSDVTVSQFSLRQGRQGVSEGRPTREEKSPIREIVYLVRLTVSPRHTRHVPTPGARTPAARARTPRTGPLGRLPGLVPDRSPSLRLSDHADTVGVRHICHRMYRGTRVWPYQFRTVSGRDGPDPETGTGVTATFTMLTYLTFFGFFSPHAVLCDLSGPRPRVWAATWSAQRRLPWRTPACGRPGMATSFGRAPLASRSTASPRRSEEPTAHHRRPPAARRRRHPRLDRCP